MIDLFNNNFSFSLFCLIFVHVWKYSQSFQLTKILERLRWNVGDLVLFKSPKRMTTIISPPVFVLWNTSRWAFLNSSWSHGSRTQLKHENTYNSVVELGRFAGMCVRPRSRQSTVVSVQVQAGGQTCASAQVIAARFSIPEHFISWNELYELIS